MDHTSTLGSKGQIIVPIEVLRRLGLKEGDRVEFVVQGERTIMRPAHADVNPFERYAGALCGFRSKREIDAWVRSLRNEDGH